MGVEKRYDKFAALAGVDFHVRPGEAVCLAGENGSGKSTLAIHHFSGGTWQTIPGTVDPLTHTVVFSTPALGSFALGVDGGVMYQIDATMSPCSQLTGTSKKRNVQFGGMLSSVSVV